ncbi:MAG: TaqI-like C-terminal specificity domain-containing protein, partial [Candidatus Pacearchaeota archaeon]
SIIIYLKEFDVASGQIIIKLKKENPKKEHEVIIIDDKKNTFIKTQQVIWNKPDDEYKFRFSFSSEKKSIIDKLKDFSNKLSYYTLQNNNLRTNTMLLDMEKKFTTNQFLDKENIFPYYQGSKSLPSKYAPLKHYKYFIYDKTLQDNINEQLKIELARKGIKNKKRIGLGEKIIYENPKLYIRQSAKELIASVDLNKSAANNSLYVISFRDNSEESLAKLYSLCAFLNSNIATFFAQETNIIRYTNGKQPQIKITDLENIIIPKDFEVMKQIGIIAKKIYLQREQESLYCKQIDTILYEYYRLTKNEIEIIESSIINS